MKKMLMYCLFVLLTFFSGIGFALPMLMSKIHCPPASEIKKIELIRAFQDKDNPKIWNFASTAITYDGEQWNIWCGTFLPNISSNDEALRQGQTYFTHTELAIKHPRPYHGSVYYLCDYMPEGADYWIAAANPPTYDKMP
jgi:hypothetical protein